MLIGTKVLANKLAGEIKCKTNYEPLISPSYQLKNIMKYRYQVFGKIYWLNH